MRKLSLTARTALDAPVSGEVEVVLISIHHDDLDVPVRLSSDPTLRLSDDPLVYGTRSTWDGADPADTPYLFGLMSALLPSDIDDAPASTSLVLDNVDSGIGEVLRSVTTPATVHMALVLASSPDLVEAEFRDLRLVSCNIEAGQVALELSRQAIEDEKYPSGRFSRWWFPGMWP